MIILRFGCVVVIAVCAFILYKIFRAIGLEFLESACFAVISTTLPSFQVFVGNAPWLAIPLLCVFSAVYVSLVGLRVPSVSRTRLFVFQQLLFLCALGIYQSIVLVAVPLVLLTILFGTSIRDRFVLFTLGGLFPSVAIYYLAWRLVWFLFADGRVEHISATRPSRRRVSTNIVSMTSSTRSMPSGR
jgi:hypothetical protein